MVDVNSKQHNATGQEENNMMKVYAVYLNDGENVYKEWIPAVSEKEARDYCKGNGEIVAVKETTGFSFNTEKIRHYP